MTGVLIPQQAEEFRPAADPVATLPSFPGSLVFISDTPVAVGPDGRLYAHALPSVFFGELAHCFDNFVLNCPLDDNYAAVDYPYELARTVRHSARPHLLHKAEFFRSPRAMAAHARAIARDIGRADHVLFRGPSPLVPLVLALGVKKKKLSAITYYCAGDFAARNQRRGAKGLVVRLYAVLERMTAARMNVIVAGHGLQKRLGGRVLFANMISADALPDSPDALLEADRRRSIAGPTRLLSVGNLDTNKNVALLIDALASVVQQEPTIHLDVVGDGPERARLIEQSESLGLSDHITFHGRIGDRQRIEDLYRQATIFVLSSRSEGVPKVLLEAGSFGVPIVATAVGGVPFLVSEDRSAELVEPDDAAAMAHAIASMASDRARRDRLIAAGLSMARRYSRENMLSEFAAAIAVGKP